MNKFVRNLITEWRRIELPFEDASIVLGVSGGADSISLALALRDLNTRKKLQLRLIIAHFNHSLRGRESDEDAEFVKGFAGRFGFELAIKKAAIASSGNLEQNARNARYTFLTETAQTLGAGIVLTAHTMNDQAETFLLNLIRGSGLRGLGAMRMRRELAVAEGEGSQNPTRGAESHKTKIELVRPLISWARREMTEQFCIDQDVKYRYDTMNEDAAFKRVRIRKILLPLLRDFNPKIIENLADTAFMLQEDFEILDELGSVALKDLLNQPESPALRLRDLKTLSPSIRRKILRDWLRNLRGDLRGLEKKHLQAIENLIFSRKSGSKVELPNGGFVRKGDGKLVYSQDKG